MRVNNNIVPVRLFQWTVKFPDGGLMIKLENRHRMKTQWGWALRVTLEPLINTKSTQD